MPALWWDSVLCTLSQPLTSCDYQFSRCMALFVQEMLNPTSTIAQTLVPTALNGAQQEGAKVSHGSACQWACQLPIPTRCHWHKQARLPVDTSDKSLHATLHMLALHHSLHTLLHLHEQTLPRRLHQDPAHCKFHADVLTGHWLKKTLPPTCRLCRHPLDTRQVSGHLCSLCLGLSGWRTGTLGFHVRPYCCATISPRPLSNGGGHLLDAFPRVRGSAEHALGQVLPAHDNSKV